jgi:hypothetical protein
MRNIWLAMAAAAGLVILPSVARGDTLFDNTNITPVGSDFIGANNNFGPLADSFSTGASSFAFNSLSLVLNALTPGDNNSFTIALLSDSSTAPGSVLETFGTVNDSSLSTAFATYTFNGPTFTLAPSTRYWIELSSPNSSANWLWTLDDSGTGVAGQFFFISQQGGVQPDSDGPYLMAIPGVQISSTPEAGTLLSLAVGLGAIFLLRRKRLLNN